jgi:Fe-S cluster assembly iron-binding protein IscA
MGLQAKKTGITLVVLSAMSAGSVGVAQAASTTRAASAARAASTTRHKAGLGHTGLLAGGGRTALTGATLQSVSNAATAAVPGGTVERAFATPGATSGTAYVVLMKKADGSQVRVREGASFNVLAVSASAHADWQGRGGSGRSKRAALTGATLASASDAALAAVPGASVTRAFGAKPTGTSGVAYAVLMSRADGSNVMVLEDSAFKVLSDSTSARNVPGHTR